jgi:WD40 repeat protein
VTCRVKYVMTGHSSMVTSVVFSSDDSHIVSGSWDKTVQIWSAETGKCVLKGHSQNVTSHYSLHSTVELSYHMILKQYSYCCLKMPHSENTLLGHSDVVVSVVFSSDGSYSILSLDHGIKQFRHVIQ